MLYYYFMFELILIVLIIFLSIALFFVISKLNSVSDELSSLAYLKRSQSVRYGQLTEQWIPFSNKFPFLAQDFKFIGKPIDGIVFDENKVVFIEFKTNKSSLNKNQKQIKELIENKKVEWFEFRID